MALSDNAQPHFTTIADFIASLDWEILGLFLEILMICAAMGLIGKEMFAVDGCKMPSNASKEWSGIKEELQHKKEKIEKAIRQIIRKHSEIAASETSVETKAQEEQYVETLKKKTKKIREWPKENDDKPGKQREPLKSNLTDNESAKMKTSGGMIQGYNGVAVVDDKRQVITHAEAFGASQEHDLSEPTVEGTQENYEQFGERESIAVARKLLGIIYRTLKYCWVFKEFPNCALADGTIA